MQLHSSFGCNFRSAIQSEGLQCDLQYMNARNSTTWSPVRCLNYYVGSVQISAGWSPTMNKREFRKTVKESRKQQKWIISHGHFPLKPDLDLQGLRPSPDLCRISDWFGDVSSKKARSGWRLWYTNTLKKS